MKNKLLLLDEKGVIWINTRRSPFLDSVMGFATFLGNGPLWIAIVVLRTVWAGIDDTLAQQLAIGLVINVTLYKILKNITGRPRPYQQILVVEQCARVPDEFSFPSGHMAAACVMVVIAGSAFSAALVPLLILAILIGSSRVYLGMHYPSDVLAGALLGILSGFSSMQFF